MAKAKKKPGDVVSFRTNGRFAKELKGTVERELDRGAGKGAGKFVEVSSGGRRYIVRPGNIRGRYAGVAAA